MKKNLNVLLFVLLVSVLLAACTPRENDGTGNSVNINEIHEKVKEELGEDYLPSMELSLEELSVRTGINPANVEEFVAEIPMIGVYVDTFIAVQAADGEGDAVEASLTTYKDQMIEQSMQYPMNMAKVEATEVVRHGDYVFFTMLGALDDVNDPDSAEGLKFAQDENQRVISVINSFFN